MEYPLLSLDAEGLPQSLKYLEDTAHRVQGHWLAISDQVEPETAALLQAAAAYVPQSALTARLQAEEAMLAELEAQGIRVRKLDYYSLHRAAREYFRRNREALGCTQRVWEELGVFLGF